VAAVVGLSFLALGMGAGAEAMVGQGALDRLTMRDAEVDPRVVVVDRRGEVDHDGFVVARLVLIGLGLIDGEEVDRVVDRIATLCL